MSQDRAHSSVSVQSEPRLLLVSDRSRAELSSLLRRFGIELSLVAAGHPIPGSYWGEPEAGVIGARVFARADTPLHSLLHEACHLIVMSQARRRGVVRDAGGDDTEESAVCYLQLLLADELPGVGSRRLAADMDAWGYSFRLGSTWSWFRADAEDALGWLRARALVSESGLLPGSRP